MTVEQLKALLDTYPDDMNVILCVEEIPYLPIDLVKVDDFGGAPSIPALLLVADMSYA